MVQRDPHQLFDTLEQKAALEARNGLLQFDAVTKMVQESFAGFELTPETLKQLHWWAIHDIYTCAGNFRDGPVYLSRAVVDPALHQPPPCEQVVPLVNDMCEYINKNFGKSPVHLSAYVMWRHNWIHPFFGGNGRTSRAASYLVLCERLGFQLPGINTIAEQIERRPDRYQQVLQQADAAWAKDRLDISGMEELISDLLAAQLMSVHDQATGKKIP